METEGFQNWLKKLRRRENTIKGYSRYVKELPEIDFVNMREEEIQGILNSRLVSYPNSVARSAFVSLIEYLYSKIPVSDPLVFEQFRIKKNNILGNIELPKEKKEYSLDLERYYIHKKKLVGAIEAVPVLVKQVILLNYDGCFRINELLKNTWSNIDENGIFIPRKLAKSNRERQVDWIYPESKEIIRRLKGEDSKKFSETTGYDYMRIWRALSYAAIGDFSFNPHSLRHTGPTDLAWSNSKKWELGRLQARCGHSDPKITQRYIAWAAHREERIISLGKYCLENKIDLGALVGL